jgi:4'-phosphopantetheinyl transferase
LSAPTLLHPALAPWSQPSGLCAPNHGTIQVWRAFLGAPDEARMRLRSTLDEGERARADRFVLARHRHEFTVARGFLRDVLGQLLETPARHIRFDYEAKGKPRIAAGNASSLRFNLSHSGGLALLAVTRDREIGADIEALRPVSQVESLAERYFAAEEGQALRSLPEAERNAAFLRCWTLKEAYVKAMGGGLSIPLDRFVVGFVPPAAEPSLRFLDPDGQGVRWTLATVDPGPGYVGALAVEGGAFARACFDWEP